MIQCFNVIYHYCLGDFDGDAVNCGIERAKFALNNLPIEPDLDKSCNFNPKQCSSDMCWCVHPLTGMIVSDGAVDLDASCEREYFIYLSIDLSILFYSILSIYLADCLSIDLYIFLSD